MKRNPDLSKIDDYSLSITKRYFVGRYYLTSILGIANLFFGLSGLLANGITAVVGINILVVWLMLSVLKDHTIQMKLIKDEMEVRGLK